VNLAELAVLFSLLSGRPGKDMASHRLLAVLVDISTGPLQNDVIAILR
jgi:hypothetical protein